MFRICVLGCVCACVWVCVCTCVSMCLGLRVCAFVWVYVCACVCVDDVIQAIHVHVIKEKETAATNMQQYLLFSILNRTRYQY